MNINHSDISPTLVELGINNRVAVYRNNTKQKASSVTIVYRFVQKVWGINNDCRLDEEHAELTAENQTM